MVGGRLCQAAVVDGEQATTDLSRRAGPLVGPGLVLREWNPRDLTAMVELFDDPDVGRWTPLPSPFTLVDAGARLLRAREPDRLLLAVTTDGRRPLGEVLLTADGELGYVLGRQHRGHGLATRALLLLREHAHHTVGLDVLRLRIDPENRASVSVAQRTGFRLARPAAETVEQKGRQVTLDVWEHARPPGDATG